MADWRCSIRSAFRIRHRERVVRIMKLQFEALAIFRNALWGVEKFSGLLSQVKLPVPAVCRRTKIRQSRTGASPPLSVETSLLSRPRGAVGSGAAAVEFAADSVVALSCGCLGGFGIGVSGYEVRLCDPCVPRVRPCIYRVSRLPPVSFYRSLVPFTVGRFLVHLENVRSEKVY
jgi:hypothetical protein